MIASLQPQALWLAVLVGIFIVKHLVADFLLQTTWMAVGKERPAGWLAPLAAHAGVHALMTAAIALAVAPSLVWLAAVDFVIHATVDRGKSVVGRVAAVEPYGQRFWWLIGIDQALHQITHLGFCVVLASA